MSPASFLHPARARELFFQRIALNVVSITLTEYTLCLQRSGSIPRIRLPPSTHADMFKPSSLLLRTLSETIYAFVILLIIVAAGLSSTALISQAVRTSPRQDSVKNWNALVVGASYIILVGFALVYLLHRYVN